VHQDITGSVTDSDTPVPARKGKLIYYFERNISFAVMISPTIYLIAMISL
jgi:hypothetical protein